MRPLPSGVQIPWSYDAVDQKIVVEDPQIELPDQDSLSEDETEEQSFEETSMSEMRVAFGISRDILNDEELQSEDELGETVIQVKGNARDAAMDDYIANMDPEDMITVPSIFTNFSDVADPMELLAMQSDLLGTAGRDILNPKLRGKKREKRYAKRSEKSGKSEKSPKFQDSSKEFVPKKDGFDIKALMLQNATILDFIQSSLQSLPLAPMTKGERYQVMSVAKLYNIKLSGAGSGKRKYIVLNKTRTTCVPEGSIKEHMASIAISSYIPKASPSPMPRQKNGTLPSSNHREKTPAFKPKEGTIVGEDSVPIGNDNLGNKMLRSMGWDGGILGSRGNGLASPVEAIVKTSRQGLGWSV